MISEVCASPSRYNCQQCCGYLKNVLHHYPKLGSTKTYEDKIPVVDRQWRHLAAKFCLFVDKAFIYIHKRDLDLLVRESR